MNGNKPIERKMTYYVDSNSKLFIVKQASRFDAIMYEAKFEDNKQAEKFMNDNGFYDNYTWKVR